MIEILSSGLPNVVQDLGRTGHLRIGVSRSGAMDALALSAANGLVANEAAAAGIEIGLFPFRLRFRADLRFACTGADAGIALDGRALPPWWSASATAGQTLEIAAPRRGARVYLAFSGGIDVPLVLGSRSTDLKGGFGGLEGRGLRRGDLLPLRPPRATQATHATGGHTGILPASLPRFWQELAAGCIVVRAVAGAEHEHFTEASRAAFANEAYEVTREANRMGYRLSGSALALQRPLELFSHGILPGTVQVPPSGQPIVQLAEANTCGGYPKIAHVIDIDLWRLAQARPGTRVRFELLDPADALAQAAVETARCDALKQALRRPHSPFTD
ncbi:biotin-dependent carboxyltransferase family protein [Variovorax sp. CY25R-8]|uniref:5-oxoprolinase subunit C family protein n=1 Tax=Variovorax sp. CY25R-8 TaxID=2855501 RepID=UPI0021BA89DD|nr:biotin-dependent carboxyltransferase family protein [Variovorax sp. CY25R-8]MCT8179216.1 biotin-dependent carboxyltransferase family protein [Variovorax sp. CY25R-8]